MAQVEQAMDEVTYAREAKLLKRAGDLAEANYYLRGSVAMYSVQVLSLLLGVPLLLSFVFGVLGLALFAAAIYIEDS